VSWLKPCARQVTLHGALADILRLCLGLEQMSGQKQTFCGQKVIQSVDFLVAVA
jgi:hypothetical protein